MIGDYCVLVAIKNGEEFIRETIESIKEQECAPTEVIFIDDGSQDRGIDIISKEFSSATILQNSGIGQAAALNTGMRYSRTKFVTFLDADDLWPANKNLDQIQFLVDNEDIDAVCGGVTNFFGNFVLPLEGEKARYFAESRAFGASMFRRSTFEKYGYFEPGHIHFPFSWWSRAIKVNITFVYSYENALYRRVHKKNEENSSLNRSELLEHVRNHFRRVLNE